MTRCIGCFAFLVAVAFCAPASLAGESDHDESSATDEPTYRGDSEAAYSIYAQGIEAYEAANYAEAARLLEQAFQLYEEPIFIFNVGQCHRMGRRHAEALAAFERYLEICPPSVLDNRVHVMMGECLLYLDRRQEANEAYRRYLQAEEGGEHAAEAREAIETGQPPPDPERRDPETVRAARDVFDRAEELYDQRQYREAAALFIQGYEQHPNVHELLFNAGLAYCDAQAWDDAIATFRRYLETPDPLPEAWARLAEAITAQGNLAAALEAYERYLELDADGQFAEQARQVVRFLRRLERIPSREELAQAKQINNRAREHFNAGRYNAAIRDYLEASEGLPTPTIRYNLGACFYNLRRYDDALRCFTEYMEIVGDHGKEASVHLDMARCLIDLNRRDEAREHVFTYRERADEEELPNEDTERRRSSELELECKRD